MYERKTRVRRIIADFAIGAVGLLLLALLLASVQTNLSVRRQEDNSLTKLAVARQRLEQNAAEAEENLATYDAFGQSKIDAVAFFLERNPAYADAAGFAFKWGLSEFYLVGADRKGGGKLDFSDASLFDGLFAQGKAVTVGGMRYYAAARSGGGYYVGGDSFAQEDAKLATLCSPSRALKTIRVGTSGYVIAVDRDGIIQHHPDESLVGRKAADIGMDPVKYAAGFDGKLSLNGVKMYCITQEASGYLLAAVIPQSELVAYNQRLIGLLLGTFAVVCLLLISYSLLLRENASKLPAGEERYRKVSNRLYIDLSMAAKLKNIVLIGLIAVFAVSFYVQTLAALSRQAQLSDTKLAAANSILDDNEERIQLLTQEYGDEYTERAHSIAYTLREDPTLLEENALEALAKRAQIQSIFVFDRHGRVAATNTAYQDFVISTQEGDQSYPFWDVVKGYSDVLVQPALKDDVGNYVQYVGVGRLDADGMVEIGMSPKRLEKRLAATELDYVLRSIAMENDGTIFAVDKQTGLFSSHEKQKYIGRPAADYGLGQNALRDDFTGYQTIDGEQCLVNCAEREGIYLYAAVPIESINDERTTVSLIVTLASLLVMLGISALLLFCGKPRESAAGEAGEEQAGTNENRSSKFFSLLSPSGKTRLVQSAASRWNGAKQPWSELSPEQKMLRLTSLFLTVAALALVCYLWVIDGKLERNSILYYILGMQWEKTPNLFAFTYIGIVLLEVLVLSTLARKAILLITQRFGARSETVGRLLDSFIKYLSILGGIFYCLTFVGFDSATLLTSAGLLTLIVGLGAQRLISDILAGVFIVFEGEFRVGDIVTVGDWRGTVLEIGIRTTKIESGGHDIKIFNNSDISGVVNMTKQFSYAFADIGVEYGESLERVESVLDKELPAMAKRIKTIVSGPFYKGVQSLDQSSVNIRIVAECKEADRIQLARDMNRELKLIFDRNGIGIPFPQIVVNQPSEFKQATKSDKKNATAFVEEQKTLAPTVEEES